MREFKVAFGENRQSRRWKNGTITLDDLRRRLSSTFRTGETVAEYQKMSGKARSDAKDKGGFVGGALKDGVRSRATVECRSMLTLDVDSASLSFLDEYCLLSPYETLIYSTHSHTPAAPRYRLVLPLTRDINCEEYNAITRLFAAEQGIEMFDICSFVPSQLMFWPTTPSDGEYVYREVEGYLFDPDMYLARHPDWTDPLLLPTSSKEAPPHEGKAKAEDPLAKEGIVGTFCRAMGTIQNAIDTYLSDVYERVSDNRYRLISSPSLPGVICYDDRFAYSYHATDPATHRVCNAFDLIRIHRFPDENEKASYSKMVQWATSLPDVNRLLLEEKQAAAREAFSDADDDPDWKDRLTRDRRGNIENTLHNLGLIMTFDPHMRSIVYNQLADGMEITGPVPWNHPSRFWRDADDAQLIWYVEQNYGSFSKRNFDIAVAKTVDDRSYHPIRDYFESLPPWDGIPRVDTVLIDYLGARDNAYVRAVTRKALCAAHDRVYHPGTKFDYITVLNGDQGIGKSTFISKIGMDWFSDSLTLSDMNDKTAAEKLQGYWIHEIGEMAGMKKADLEKVKAFVSRQDDKYRASFGRRVSPHPRQCIFFGTTNSENGYLRDITGNRRFWNVRVSGNGKYKPWDLDQDTVDQIWAEVKVLTEAGEPLYLPPELEEFARNEQRDAMEQDDREGLVREYLDMLLPASWDKMDLFRRREYVHDPDDPTRPDGVKRRDTVSNMEIWCECFCKNREDLRPSDSYAISAIMVRIGGWEKSKSRPVVPPYGQQRVYCRTA